jgi:hypothetical protein
LAQHYASVIYQGTASDQDYITTVNFDGDWIGATFSGAFSTYYVHNPYLADLGLLDAP